MQKHNVSIISCGMIIQKCIQPGFKGWDKSAVAMVLFYITFLLAAIWFNQIQLAVVKLSIMPRQQRHFYNNLVKETCHK